jgi:hypothetical protein
MILINDAGIGTMANPNPNKINVKPKSLGVILRSYKSAVTYRIYKEIDPTKIGNAIITNISSAIIRRWKILPFTSMPT